MGLSTHYRAAFSRRGIALWLGALLLAAPLPTASAQAAAGHRVDLRVLLLTDGGPSTTAIATQLDREGVPYTSVNLTAANRPAIDAAYLENAAMNEGRFQAVVLPNQAGTASHGLTSAELTALSTYERTYGVRQVDAYVYPGAAVGLSTPSYSGALDGATATVTAQGLAGPFPYLKSSLVIDNVDPAITEIYGYLAGTAPSLPAGQTFTPLVNATVGASTGSVVGVYAHDFREELVITAAFNSNQRLFGEIGHGIVTWMTRGLHLGYHRNYFAVQVDDIFLADSRWSSAGHCTPGDDCIDPTVTTTDIRMTPADVSRLLAWQNANGFTLDMVFNASGSDLAATQNGGTDPLTAALTAAGTENQFTWINHTYTHTYLGCIQIAPTVVGQTWRCATAGDTGPYIEPELVPASQTLVNGTEWLSQSAIAGEIQQNLTWVAAHPLTHFDPAALVTGEHSGLLSLPQQTVDNPLLAPALAATGIKYTASDASREAGSRTIGSAVTVPRHPMNIYYNVGTYGDEVSEYNWIYTSAADGGSGICTANPATTTCITPLPNATAAEAKASFEGYIVPLEVRNAYLDVVSGDPRPFYAHQSNLAEDGVLYPVVQGVLDQYNAAIDTAKSPIVHADMKTQAQALSRMTSWGGAASGVTAYVDSAGVHVSGAAGTQVPLTVPTGTTSGSTLDAYDGELSGWISGSATDTVVAVPATPMGGYVGVTVPPAPAASATRGNASAVVTWTMSGDGGTPVTGYVVKAYSGTGTTVLQTLNVAAPATSVTVTGLTNGSEYTFDVTAVNGFGTGPASARTAVVVPAALPGAPTLGTVTGGNASATLSWTAPSDTGGLPITGYTVRVYVGADTTAQQTLTAAASATGLTVTGLTNGTAYTVDVAATNDVGTGPASARSAAVTPVTVPGAPVIGVPTRDNASATLSWTAPSDTGGSPITGYTVRVYVGADTTAQQTLTAAASATGLTVTGLTNGTAYTVDVAATNDVGTGPASARSAAVTPANLPGAPVIGVPTRGNASAVVRWTAPATNGGSPITGYTVRVHVGTATTVLRTVTASATATSLTVTGLTNGTAYTFDVAATNDVGTGPASARSAAVTPATVPGAPVIGVPTRGNASAVVRWTAPATNGGSPITGYTVRVHVGTATTVLRTVTASATATSLTVTGLTNGTAYTVDVAATNAVGTGPASARSAAVTPATLPGAPVIGVAAAGAAGGAITATARWTPPASTGGSPITGYRVTALRLTASGKLLGTTVSAVRPASARSLAMTLPVTGSYRFKVQAINAVGGGLQSPLSNMVTAR